VNEHGGEILRDKRKREGDLFGGEDPLKFQTLKKKENPQAGGSGK